jgi:hypothetical protein
MLSPQPKIKKRASGQNGKVTPNSCNVAFRPFFNGHEETTIPTYCRRTAAFVPRCCCPHRCLQGLSLTVPYDPSNRVRNTAWHCTAAHQTPTQGKAERNATAAAGCYPWRPHTWISLYSGPTEIARPKDGSTLADFLQGTKKHIFHLSFFYMKTNVATTICMLRSEVFLSSYQCPQLHMAQ